MTRLGLEDTIVDRGVTISELQRRECVEVAHTFPYYKTMGAENKTKAERWIAEAEAWRQASVEQFRAEMARGRIVTLECSQHYVFFSSESDVVREGSGLPERRRPPLTVNHRDYAQHERGRRADLRLICAETVRAGRGRA